MNEPTELTYVVGILIPALAALAAYIHWVAP